MSRKHKHKKSGSKGLSRLYNELCIKRKDKEDTVLWNRPSKKPEGFSGIHSPC